MSTSKVCQKQTFAACPAITEFTSCRVPFTKSLLSSLTRFLSRGNPSLWTAVVRITAVKDQDILRSDEAQGSLLQPAVVISSTEACKGRSGPGLGLIGSLRFTFYAGSLPHKAQSSSACQAARGSQKAVFLDVWDRLHKGINAHCVCSESLHQVTLQTALWWSLSLFVNGVVKLQPIKTCQVAVAE